jgi:hypothetical protein
VASSLQLAEPVKGVAAKAARRATASYGSARQQFGPLRAFNAAAALLYVPS